MSKRCIGYNDVTKEYIYYDEESGIINSQKELEKDAETGLHTINDIWWKITKDFRDKNDVKDKIIADLEAKLAETEKKFKASKDAMKFQNEEQKEWMDKYFDTAIKLEKANKQLAEKNARIAELEDKDWHNVCQELIKENTQLKQQLAEKETRIAELEDKDWYEGTIKQLEEQNGRLIKQLEEKDKEILDVKNWWSYQYEGEKQRHNQDKISFAVEQLEKVKELAHNHIKKIANDLSEEYDERLNQKHAIHGLATAITDIDNQIEELKKEMK